MASIQFGPVNEPTDRHVRTLIKQRKQVLKTDAQAFDAVAAAK